MSDDRFPFDPDAFYDPDGRNEAWLFDRGVFGFADTSFSPRHPLGPFNPDAPFGFRFIKMEDGTSATYGLRASMISRNNRQKIFRGDCLARSADGFFSLARRRDDRNGDDDDERPKGDEIGGVAWAFEWVSFTEEKTVRKNWWPGNGDAIGDITVYMHSNPGAIFEVQAFRGPIQQRHVGFYGDFNIGRGGIMIGAGNQSSFTLDDRTLSQERNGLPFRIYQLPIFGPQTPFVRLSGYNPRHRFNRVWVMFANVSVPA